MKHWILASSAAALSLVSMTGAAYASPAITVQSVFHMPKPEAIGAAIGAVGAVQIAMRWRARKDAANKPSGDEE